MMEVTNKAFKAYDVRGVYPTEVNEEMAYRVGRIFSAMFAAETVVVGQNLDKIQDANNVEEHFHIQRTQHNLFKIN